MKIFLFFLMLSLISCSKYQQDSKYEQATTLDGKNISVKLKEEFIAISELKTKTIKKETTCIRRTARLVHSSHRYPCIKTYTEYTGMFAELAESKDNVKFLVNPQLLTYTSNMNYKEIKQKNKQHNINNL